MSEAATSGGQRLADVRQWFSVTLPGPGLLARLDRVYTVALSAGMAAVVVFSTAHSALSQVIDARTTAVWGPVFVVFAILAIARWGVYQGPVVFSEADVAHTLGAPLPRRGLAWRPLWRAVAYGVLAGAVLASVAIVGLDGGSAPTLAVSRSVGLGAGLALACALGVACAWAVQASMRIERALRLLSWPLLGVVVVAAIVARSDAPVRDVLVWSGLWGWAVAPVSAGAWPLALALLVIVAGGGVVAATMTLGRCPTERHVLRAQARQRLAASLFSMDARTGSRALRSARGTVGAAPRRRPTRMLGHPAGQLIARRDAIALGRMPARLVEAAVLAAAGTVVVLLAADRAVAALAGVVAVYVAATRLLEPMRREVDAPGRARILLRARWGEIAFGHAVLPALLLAVVAGLTAAACAAVGALDATRGAIVPLAILAGPLAVACASMSARRGGRLPMSVLAMAGSASDAGGFVVVAWILVWPAVTVVVGGAPIAIVAHHGATPSGVIAAVIVVASAVGLLGSAVYASEEPRD